ncbi:hypothetical protein U9M48_013905 [Paspalum notatum var. saurae]|uniref:Uncharacterized protein n=1 Tax=Paspalum notatum var. saurae TaxID=547442 RepID=A0AAQ3T1D1_PASNO
METAAAAMLEAGVGRFSRAPAMAAALLAEMWAPLAVALAALATLPSLLRRLQLIVLRIRSRGKEVIQSHIVGTYYSSSGEDDDDVHVDDESSDEDGDDGCSSSGDDEEDGEDLRRIGFYEAADGAGFPWGGAVVRTWQGLPRRFSGCVGGAPLAAGAGGPLPPAAVRLWGARTASGADPWWATALVGAEDGGCVRAAESEAASGDHAAVVVGWAGGRDSTQAVAQNKRRRRRAASSAL